MADQAAAGAGPGLLTFPQRLAELAAERPGQRAVVQVGVDGAERHVTYAGLWQATRRAAGALAAQGVGRGSLVAVVLGNGLEHLVAAQAVWAAGACPLPLSPRMPEAELSAVLAVAEPALVLGIGGVQVDELVAEGPEHEPDVVPCPGLAFASGGSTGRPKVIVDQRPLAFPRAFFSDAFDGWMGFRPDQVQLVAGPLYHNMPFTCAHMGLFEGHSLVLLERFDAATAVAAAERHRVTWMSLVPTMMQRILRVPGLRREQLATVEAVFHGAAPCPAWVKEGWIDLVGAARVYEGYTASEGVGRCGIRGDEWLAHRGSVGRPYRTELRVLGADGRDLPPGEVGELYLRPAGDRATFTYKGDAAARVTDDGFTSVGDLGWVDADGYVYLADRRTDLIIRGGANVYPAEVEAALSEHPAVRDVAVVGVADDDVGQQVHAHLELEPGMPVPPADELRAHCRARLSAYKVPVVFHVVPSLERTDAGKLRRSRLAQAAPAPAPAEG